MSQISDLILQLQRQQIRLWLEDDKLCFQAPKGAFTSDLKAQVKQHQQEVIKFLQEAQGSINTQEKVSQSIPRLSRSSSSILSLSLAQQRLWFLDQLEGGSATYNMPVALKIVGNLNQSALDKAINTIVQRHEILRTNFDLIEGEPSQIIREESNLSFNLIDLKALPEQEKQNKVESLIDDFAKRPFDLSQSSLIRANLLCLENSSYILLLNFHHIVFDGWSASVFIRELSTLYNNFSQGLPSTLPELPIQYADFASWQRQWLSGQALENQLNYWKQHLENAPPLLELPTDYSRPPIQSYQGSSYSFLIPSIFIEKLKLLTQQTKATEFMLLLATFSCLLYRYSLQTDLVIGSPIANRNRPEIENLIGFFANTLALRLKVSQNLSFLSFLEQVKQVTLNAYSHQDLPFEKIVEELQPERNLSYNPIFQVMFALQNASNKSLELSNVMLEMLESDSGMAHFDLSLHIYPSDEGWTGIFSYSTDLFHENTIKRMGNHFLRLLEEVLTYPQKQISQLSLLTDSEKKQLIYEWNKTETVYPLQGTIYQLFEVQVNKTPTAIALMNEHQAISYQELNAKSNQLARYLQSLNVQPNTIVGIFMERSLEIVISILGILKAGGAYLALDPDYPKERLKYMLEDAQISLVITQSTLLKDVPSQQVQTLCLDQIESTLSQYNGSNLTSPNLPEHLAYLIYTSGSTGHPKGVMVTHENLSHYVQALSPALDIKDQDRYLHTASFSFSSSVRQLMLPLSQGATVVISNREQRQDPLSLFKLIKQTQVSVLDIIPSFWRNCINIFSSMNREEIQDLLNNHLRLIVSASEPLLADIPRIWKTQFQPHINLINMFGQTETTGIVAVYPIKDLAELGNKIVPIGRPIANTQFYILDLELQPTPIGIQGNLYIGGLSLAKGYLNQESLTDEKFLPNPFKNIQDDRIYHTGDLAKYREDGTIEHLGRSDYQIKIRGFRVELAEIEAVLNTHSDVKETTIVAQKTSDTEHKIVAYVVPSISLDRIPYEQDCMITYNQMTIHAKTENIAVNGVGIKGDLAKLTADQVVEIDFPLPHLSDIKKFKAQIVWHQRTKAGLQFFLDPEQQSLLKDAVDYLIQQQGLLQLWQRSVTQSLRNHFKKKLPEYMIPQQFVLLDELPRLPNGKINRKALPDAELSREDLDAYYVAPRNQTEETLATIWCEVLKLSQVGIYDNFFELGGHSLLATQVTSRIRESFQIDFPLRKLFEHPTIADLSESIIIQLAEQVQNQDELEDWFDEIDRLSDEEVQKLLENS